MSEARFLGYTTRKQDVALIRSIQATLAWREKFACKKCGEIPDEEGVLRHLHSCHVFDSDGGGAEKVEGF